MVDYYLIGVFIYELMTGQPPFYDDSKDKIFHSIENKEVDIPHYI